MLSNEPGIIRDDGARDGACDGDDGASGGGDVCNSGACNSRVCDSCSRGRSNSEEAGARGPRKTAVAARI